MRPNEVPQISPQEFAERLKTDSSFVILDVREPAELRAVSLKDRRLVNLPLSQLAAFLGGGLPQALQDKQAEIIVLCHHGERSRQMTMFLLRQGWQNVRDLRGGIDAYARQVDPTIRLY
jgi:rhodanese-related sulfurtransferase